MPHDDSNAVIRRASSYGLPPLYTVEPISLGDRDVPDRRWMVPDWVPHGQVTMLGGDGGLGKTLLAQMLLTSCATGQAWLGLPVERCKVLGVFCEDDRDELHRRQVKINAALDVDFGDLEGVLWIPRVGDENLLATFDYDEMERAPFFQQIHNAAQDFGAQLIVLDSLHDLFSGNENNRPQARQFINLLRGLAGDCDGAVVLTAHPSLSGMASGSGMSGSTAWNNAVRSRLYLTRPRADDGAEADEDERVLARKKSNYARVGDRIALTWRDGVFVAKDQPQGVFAGMASRNAERVFLEQLDAVMAEGRTVSERSRAGNYGPKIFAKRPGREGFARADFVAAMERLFSDGKIKIEMLGDRPSRQLPCIVRVEGDE